MLDLIKQYNENIEKIIKIIGLVSGTCLVCVLFIFEEIFSNQELKIFLVVGGISVLALVGFLMRKVRKEFFDCLLLIMMGIFLAMISNISSALVFMMICLFITIINGRFLGLLSSFVSFLILLMLGDGYFSGICLIVTSYFVGGWRNYFYESRDFATGVLSESCFYEVLDSFICKDRSFSLILIRMMNHDYPQFEKKVAKVFYSQFTFKYGIDGFIVILPEADKGKSVQWLEERVYEIKDVELRSAIVFYPDDGVQLVKKLEDMISKQQNSHRYAWMIERVNKVDCDLVTTIKLLMGFLKVWDVYTYGHVLRVVEYSELLGRELGISEEEVGVLVCGAYLHDIGKLDMDQFILNKKMPLEEEEWLRLKTHTERGSALIHLFEELAPFREFIEHHHERFDGRGYPSHLVGSEIPFLVRILTVADSFDAMTSKRSYNQPKTFEEGIEELRRCSGDQFDPDIVEAFANVMKREYS